MSKNKNDFTQSWNLEDIMPLEQWQDTFDMVKKSTNDLYADFKANVYSEMSTQDFAEFMHKYETLDIAFVKLYSVVSLSLAVDMKDKSMLKRKAQLDNLELHYGKKVTIINHWLKGVNVKNKTILDDDNAHRLLSAIPENYNIWQNSRKKAKHLLTSSEEMIVAAKDISGISVLQQLREVVESEMQFSFHVPGSKKQIIENLSELNAHTQSADAGVRKEAYRARFEQFEKHAHTFFLMYQAIVKDWVHFSELRKYNSAISRRNVANDLSDSAVSTFMKVTESNRFIFQDFFKLKAKLLNLKKLNRTDILAPVGSYETTFNYSQALEIVQKSYDAFSSQFADYAQKIIQDNHIDVMPKTNKQGGAFCMQTPQDITPYVLLNFTGKHNDVSTLAHELGHGIHDMYTKKQSYWSSRPSIPLAETASTLGETILFESLLAAADSKDEKQYLLVDKLTHCYSSILRQNYITKFEIAAHNAIPKGISEQELSDLWLQSLQDQYGDSIELDPMFRYEWAYIPHILHTPFYCYGYTFGDLLSLALYQKYKQEGSDFIPKIENILEAGGSDSPVNILANVGIDLESEAFWQDAFTPIKDWYTQLQNL